MSAISARVMARALPLAALAALATATLASAQTVDTVRESRTCICTPGATSAPFAAALFGNRSRLGIFLGDAVQVDGGNGVRVDEVVEGGPAERAGLRAGDIVVAMNGTNLGDHPADAVTERMADVEPGDTVTLSYRRDGKALEARVVTERARLADLMMNGRAAFDRMRDLPDMPRIQRIERMAVPGALRLWGERTGVEMVDMNPGLGRYFGTQEGALVVQVRDDSLGLRAGDVILSIGDRTVSNVAHARRIIASYRPDESIRFTIMRDRKRTTVTGHIENAGR